MQYAASFNDLFKTEQALIDARIKFKKMLTTHAFCMFLNVHVCSFHLLSRLYNVKNQYNI